MMKLIFWMFFGLVLSSCGVEMENTKNYILYFGETESDTAKSGKDLVKQYNEMAGMTVLRYTDQLDQATVHVRFVKGLSNEMIAGQHRTVGRGNWQATRGVKVSPTTKQVKQTVKVYGQYHMALSFDADEFSSMSLATDDEYSQAYLFVLFCHEVGHGLMMTDTYNDAHGLNVMYGIFYPDQIWNKDFASYFEEVRLFMNDPYIR